MEENDCGMPVVEDKFLESARKTGLIHVIFLVNGTEVKARIIEYDEVSIRVESCSDKYRDRPQLIYKHAIATII